jgi:hypothetical protein
MMSIIIPRSASIIDRTPHSFEDDRKPSRSWAQLSFARPYQAYVSTETRLRKGKNGQIFAEKPCNRASRHDGNANPGAHEAHHGRELGHRRNMVKCLSSICGGSVDNSSGP